MTTNPQPLNYADANTPAPGRPSKTAVWIGRALGWIPALLFIFSGVMKLTHSPQVVEGFGKFGFPEYLVVPIGVLELACVAIYLIPQTAVLGAILLAGYLGGAICTHLRLGEPWYAQAAIGVVLWFGLYLRDPRVRALAPFRRPL